MEENKIQLILASASPRRKDLLQGCFLNYLIRVSNTDENIDGYGPSELVEKLAFEKAQDVLEKSSEKNILVLGADTVVVIGDEILGKPRDTQEAREMLRKLSGKEHTVMTGVTLLTRGNTISFVEKTKVTFSKISEDLLELYLATGESLDKAGSYGIQGVALSFIEKIEGSYSNVVGLPVDRCLSEIKNIVGAGIDQSGGWRERFI